MCVCLCDLVKDRVILLTSVSNARGDQVELGCACVTVSAVCPGSKGGVLVSLKEPTVRFPFG